MERPPPYGRPVDLDGHHVGRGRGSIHKFGSMVYGLIQAPSPPPRPKLETVFFSICEVNLADNDTFCFLKNEFRHILTKIFGRFYLITLLCKLRYRLIEIFNR